MPGVFQFSQIANSNSSAVPTIDWSEGQAPSSINNSARAEMAAVACYRDDISGMLLTTGTSAAYAITATNQGFDTLANFHNKAIYFTPHVTNAAGPVTMTVDGFANLPLRSSPGKELPAGTLIQGTPYGAIYNNTDGALYLQGFYGNPYSVPFLGGMDYWDTITPNSSFIFPAGQAINRVTYAAAFARWGTTYGAGDGSTTFNVPDKTERVSVMVAALSTRLTSAFFGGNSTVLGAVGGSQSNNVILTHNHGINDPGHVHGLTGGSGPQGLQSGTGGNVNEGGSGSGGTNVSLAVASNTTGITIQNAGSASAHNIVQPTIVCNYIIRII